MYNQPCFGVDVELLHQLLAMVIDGLLADGKNSGDLFIRLPLADERKDLALAFG